jgi:hypothetical protein
MYSICTKTLKHDIVIYRELALSTACAGSMLNSELSRMYLIKLDGGSIWTQSLCPANTHNNDMEFKYKC